MMKVGFIIVALLMVSGEISTEEVSPSLSPIENSSSPPQPETEMSPSPKMMSKDYDYPSSSQFTEASDLNYSENTTTGGKKDSGGGENGDGGKKTGIVVGAIAAATMVGFGGYVLKKRRDNIRRSRYGYAATEFF